MVILVERVFLESEVPLYTPHTHEYAPCQARAVFNHARLEWQLGCCRASERAHGTLSVRSWSHFDISNEVSIMICTRIDFLQIYSQEHALWTCLDIEALPAGRSGLHRSVHSFAWYLVKIAWYKDMQSPDIAIVWKLCEVMRKRWACLVVVALATRHAEGVIVHGEALQRVIERPEQLDLPGRKSARVFQRVECVSTRWATKVSLGPEFGVLRDQICTT